MTWIFQADDFSEAKVKQRVWVVGDGRLTRQRKIMPVLVGKVLRGGKGVASIASSEQKLGKAEIVKGRPCNFLLEGICDVGWMFQAHLGHATIHAKPASVHYKLLLGCTPDIGTRAPRPAGT